MEKKKKTGETKGTWETVDDGNKGRGREHGQTVTVKGEEQKKKKERRKKKKDEKRRKKKKRRKKTTKKKKRKKEEK